MIENFDEMKSDQVIINVESDCTPDEIIKYKTVLFNQFNIPATYFVTYKTNVNFGKHGTADLNADVKCGYNNMGVELQA